MKVLAKDFHRIFSERTKPAFVELGFKRSKANAQGWQRPHDDAQVLFWPQLDKWGWNEETGSSVALNLSVSAQETTTGVVTGQGTVQPRWCRLGSLLSFDELETVRRANNVVALKTWPPNKEGELWRAFETSKRGLYAATYGPKDEPIKPGTDVWLRYLIHEDVEWIGSFIAERLPSLIDRMLANPKISASGASYATEKKT